MLKGESSLFEKRNSFPDQIQNRPGDLRGRARDRCKTLKLHISDLIPCGKLIVLKLMFQGQHNDSLSFFDVSVRQYPSIFNTVHSPRDMRLDITYILAYETPLCRLQPSSEGEITTMNSSKTASILTMSSDIRRSSSGYGGRHSRRKIKDQKTACIFLSFLYYFIFPFGSFNVFDIGAFLRERKKKKRPSGYNVHTLRSNWNDIEHCRLVLEKLRNNYLSRELVEKLQH